MTNHPKLAALAVVIRDSMVLLVKRRNDPDAGLWGFSGGHVDLGETAMDAAARELLEETTIVSHPVHYLTNVDVIEVDESNAVKFHFLLVAVLCEYISGEPLARDDVSEARWWPVDGVLKGAASCSKDVDGVVQLAVDSSARSFGSSQ
ncbi:NUDIX hydrolase [uncultured Tateyamaria sp.]|uniref:NUDIX hydrolase n=1 Tax=uncultured Tateyamaria sp. TaxID=455651 RepID=UPI00263214A8|nr:NUDIX hydrolase [uncultured Tateyamaria sp.]